MDLKVQTYTQKACQHVFVHAYMLFLTILSNCVNLEIVNVEKYPMQENTNLCLKDRFIVLSHDHCHRSNMPYGGFQAIHTHLLY